MCYNKFFLTKLLTLSILFSTAVRALVVAKLVILGISLLTPFILAWRAVVAAKLVVLGVSPLISFILAFRVVLIAKLVISGMLSSVLLILALYSVFLTTSFFTALLSLLKSTGIVSNFLISNLSTFRLFSVLLVSEVKFH